MNWSPNRVDISLVGIATLLLQSFVGVLVYFEQANFAFVSYLFFVTLSFLLSFFTERRQLQSIFVLFLCSGPFALVLFLAAIFCKISLPYHSGVRDPSSLKATALSERIDNDILANRRPLSNAVSVFSFEELFRSSEIDAQQAALRAIFRNFQPAYIQSLVAAMSSDSPAIRVQAAAVYSRARELNPKAFADLEKEDNAQK